MSGRTAKRLLPVAPPTELHRDSGGKLLATPNASPSPIKVADTSVGNRKQYSRPAREDPTFHIPSARPYDQRVAQQLDIQYPTKTEYLGLPERCVAIGEVPTGSNIH